MSLSLQQAESMAPDSGTLGRARKIAKRNKYQNVGVSERAIWGIALGSSQYDSYVDLHGPAYKCSCPVKKLPCKHIMGMLLLVANEPDAATATEMPDGLQVWLDKRDSTAQAKATKAANGDSSEVKDKAAQQRRVQARQANVEQGLDELERFLEDMISTGLIEASRRTDDLWEQMRRRLIDAQAKGLANQLETIRLMMGQGPNWTEQVLQEVCSLYTLVRSYRQCAQLPPELADDIRQRIGWNKSKEELACMPALEGDWLVLNWSLRYESDLHTQTVWLMHPESGQYAQLLNFATSYNPEAIQRGLLPGTLVHGQARFYSRWSPRRVDFQRSNAFQHQVADDFQWMTRHGHRDIRDAVLAIQQQRLRQPFPAQWPMLLHDVRLVMKEQRLALADRHGHLLLLNDSEVPLWELLAAMGDREASVFVTTTDTTEVVAWGCLQDNCWTAFNFKREDS